MRYEYIEGYDFLLRIIICNLDFRIKPLAKNQLKDNVSFSCWTSDTTTTKIAFSINTENTISSLSSLRPCLLFSFCFSSSSFSFCVANFFSNDSRYFGINSVKMNRNMESSYLNEKKNIYLRH